MRLKETQVTKQAGCESNTQKGYKIDGILSVFFDILKTLYLKVILNIQKNPKSKTSERGAREMAQLLRALASSLPEDQESDPSTYMVAHSSL